MWYEEQFCVVLGPRSLSDLDRFTGELNALGKEGWDISGMIRENAEKRELLVMNRQRQVSTQERVDQTMTAIKSRGLASAMNISLPAPLSDDGRLEYAGDAALREIVRLVLEES